MQSFLTVLFETVAVSAFAFFAIAFVTGFATYSNEQTAAPVATVPAAPVEPPLSWGKVIPFSRPYRRPACVPINWTLWSADDLKLANQRKPFDIPLRVGKKKLIKAQLVERYTAALAEVEQAAAA